MQYLHTKKNKYSKKLNSLEFKNNRNPQVFCPLINLKNKDLLDSSTCTLPVIYLYVFR